MKKLVATLVIGLFVTSYLSAGENPKLFREINRKVTVDLSGINLHKDKKHYVVAHFKIVNQEIQILKLKGSSEGLEDMIKKELTEMFIKSKADPNTVYKYKFNFEKE